MIAEAAAPLAVGALLAAVWVTVCVLLAVVFGRDRSGRRSYSRAVAERARELDRARADRDAELWADLAVLHAVTRTPVPGAELERAVRGVRRAEG